MSEQDISRDGAEPAPPDLGPRTSGLGAPSDRGSNEPPPIMKTWPRLYGLVLAVLVADVLLFWLVTRIFE